MVWQVRISPSAERDVTSIIEWTRTEFGPRQAANYVETLRLAVAALRDGPLTPGVKVRDDLRPGLMSLHVKRGRRKGRHVLVFRRDLSAPRRLVVLRILHDAMDFERHWLPD